MGCFLNIFWATSATSIYDRIAYRPINPISESTIILSHLQFLPIISARHKGHQVGRRVTRQTPNERLGEISDFFETGETSDQAIKITSKA